MKLLWLAAIGCLLALPAVAQGNSPSTNGNGTLSVGASTNINTMTVAAGKMPDPVGQITAINLGAADAALCIKGGTCTCPESGAATTNGITLLSAGGGYIFNLGGTAATVPTVVSCSGTNLVQFQW